MYVDCVTKTQIIDTDGGRWSKRTGRRIGDGQYNAWHDYIRVPTPGEVEDVKAEIDRRRLAERISWRLGSMDRVLKFSGAELQQIARIIDEHDSREDQVAAEAAGESA